MTLLEAVFALLLLSVFLVPAADALRGAIAAPGDTATAARDLDCVSGLMETVVAEPYDRLFAAAGNIAIPSSYSTIATAACPPLSVFIARYGRNANGTLGTANASDYLLYVGVRVADANAAGFPLATLVAR
ncbi:hypothetical protein IP91_00827 [Pseudoduganella lurida]|uniref:Uncharacterized protein n=1 Tax=Pseudoduganella lurida TaxID=1036180 RepID=A0A562RMB2_9BURK|nr:hypothetical protein [Pseudoduganella lurida]TWI69754.1 hypothetical protein IP91_00827 [Pseudoduganella lurida]